MHHLVCVLVCLIASENFFWRLFLTTTVRSRTKNGLGFRGFESRELCPKLQGHSEAEPKERCNPRPSRKRVVQRDCFQGATDFSERVLQRARAQKQSAAVELALPAAAAARAKER